MTVLSFIRSKNFFISSGICIASFNYTCASEDSNASDKDDLRWQRKVQVTLNNLLCTMTCLESFQENVATVAAAYAAAFTSSAK